VELVDTLDSGSSAGNSMKVQVLSSALKSFFCDIFCSFRLRFGELEAERSRNHDNFIYL